MDSLGNFACQFLVGGVEINGSAEVFSHFNEKMDLIVRMACTQDESLRVFLSFAAGSDLKLSLAGSDWVNCIPSHSDDPGDFIQVSSLRSPIVITTSEKVSKVNFQLGHLPSLQGELHLVSSDWSVLIHPSAEGSSADSKMVISGSALTHRGTLQRVDGSPFSCAEANRCLIHICRYFSFCYERWVSVANVEGFNFEGNVVFWQLGAGKLDFADSESNWLDGFKPETALKQLFPGFMSKIAHEGWEETLSLAIYWYIRGASSKVGPDGSLIILQAALERLAWQVLVQDLRVLSEDGFNKLPAADTLRLLLSQNQIPLRIPSGQNKLIDIGKGFRWNDGADAVVHTRNRLVHPPRKNSNAVKLDFYGAYTMAKWYLELILLRQAGFEGEYSNRTVALRWNGKTEPVPWRK
jgi:hypothetical protein